MFPGGDVASGRTSEIHACKPSGIGLTVWQILSQMRSTLHWEKSRTARVISQNITSSLEVSRLGLTAQTQADAISLPLLALFPFYFYSRFKNQFFFGNVLEKG